MTTCAAKQLSIPGQVTLQVQPIATSHLPTPPHPTQRFLTIGAAIKSHVRADQ